MNKENIIKGLETIKQFFGYGLPSTAEMFDSYYGILNDAIALLKEQEAAYQGAVELLRQKTILFDDAIKKLKEQEGIIPYIDIDEAKCPICKVKLTRQELIGDDVLFEDFFDYCPHCGKPVLWEGR